MGEIGQPWLEYLYEMTFCDIVLITRGYHRRHHPSWEQARLIAHQAHYCMGVGKGERALTPTEWLTFPWEREQQQADLPTEDEIAEMQALMAEMNAQNQQQENPQP